MEELQRQDQKDEKIWKPQAGGCQARWTCLWNYVG